MMTGLKKTVMLANQSSGESIVWNQLVSEIRYNSATGPNAAKEDDYYILFYKGSGLWRILANGMLVGGIVTANKHLIHFEFEWIDMGTVGKNASMLVLGKTYSVKFSVDNNISEIRVPSASTSGYISSLKTADNTAATGWKFKLKIRIHDLTLMFGAGNEPATVEEFESRISPYMSQIGNINDYNEGETISI